MKRHVFHSKDFKFSSSNRMMNQEVLIINRYFYPDYLLKIKVVKFYNRFDFPEY